MLYVSKDATDDVGEEHYPHECYPTMGAATAARELLLNAKAATLNSMRDKIHDPVKDGIRRPGENYYRVSQSTTCITDPDDVAVFVCQVRRVPFYGTGSRRTAGRRQTTGRFQTRPELEDRVLFYYYRTDMSIGQISRNCQVSHAVVSRIIDAKGGEYMQGMRDEKANA